jgi:hypothetical protein
MSRRLFVFEVFVIVNVDSAIEMDGVVLFSILFYLVLRARFRASVRLFLYHFPMILFRAQVDLRLTRGGYKGFGCDCILYSLYRDVS